MAISPIFNPKTPGVYLTELDAFPQAVVGVPTAVPAFIGYTEKAQIDGRSVLGKPVHVSSMAEYEQVFGGPPHPQYVYTLSQHTELVDSNGNAITPDLTLTVGSTPYYYVASPVSGQKSYYTYYGMELFFANGGGSCYVVSAGLYRDDKIEWDAPGQPCDLKRGLDAIYNQAGPTMLVMPEAVTLNASDYPTSVQYMVDQAAALKDRVALLDVPKANAVTQENVTSSLLQTTLDPLMRALDPFVGRGNVLSYGKAYFPWLNTTVVKSSDLSYKNFAGASAVGNVPANPAINPPVDPAAGNPPSLSGTPSQLQGILGMLNAQANPPRIDPSTNEPTNLAYVAIVNAINSLAATDSPDATAVSNNLLMNALPQYGQLLAVIAKKASVVPASPVMAGVYSLNDANKGVWNAPANMALTAVKSPTVNLTDGLQGPLNVPVDGRAVNVIRYFPGRGTVVWGARTLEGNSLDWRYIQVRRTIVYIEQSIKQAIAPYVFAPNTAQTWVAVTQMVSGFLQGLWASGGLMGAKASDAFSVQCGVPTTMTGTDVLNGIMIVQVTLQMVHPAEFIQLQFKQTMQGA